MACQALTTASCQLGDATSCAAFMKRDLGSGKVPNPTTHKPLTCQDVVQVRTRADAQKLGFACP